MNGARATTTTTETRLPTPSAFGRRPAAAGALALACAALLHVLGATAAAQSDWKVDVLIPGAISVRTASQEIAFGIGHDDYPPPQFPKRYPATLPSGGALRVDVFSNAPGSWSLLLELPDVVSTTGSGLIPAEQVLYRVNEGLWLRGSPLPQVIYTGLGPTGDWLELSIEFELELVGSEPPGNFTATTRLSALGDGGGP